MKNRFFTVVMLLVAFAALPFFTVSAGGDSVKLRVMTYNLRFGELASLDSLAAEIKEHNPDFVALQEVDVNNYREISRHMNGKNMLSELAGRTGMFGLYARAVDMFGGYYGIGILSKYPCVESKRTFLPNPKNVERRAMLKGVFELSEGREIVFVATHLDWERDDTRDLQIAAILENLKDEKLPVLVAGDFNAHPGEAPIRRISAKMVDLTDNAPTYPAKSPDEKLDYIFGMPKDCFKLESTSAIKSASHLSDHLPVVSVVECVLP